MELRDYQIDSVEAVSKEWDVEGHKNTLLVIPTGGGKTVIFSEIAKRESAKGRVLILAHRDELIRQAADKLYKSTGLFCGIEKGIESTGDMFDITIGSVQTLMRDNRLTKFAPDYFRTIVVDEAHHCLAESYRKILEYFKTARLLGVTATPDRGDKKTLAEVFDSIAYEVSLTQMIGKGYLVPPRAEMIPLHIDLSKVKTSMGDYTDSSLGEALGPYLEAIADEMVKRVQDRKTVVFLPLIATSQTFCRMLNDKGLKAAEVNGTSKDRKEILQNFEDGKYQVLCNSMLLTEGWDCPSVDCAVVLRPTKIRALYSQMIGRILRLSPETGKKDALILDFLWMTAKHDLVKPAALVAKDEKIANRIQAMLEGGEAIDLVDAEAQAVKDEAQAQRDAIEERERSLARQLSEYKEKQRKLVDPVYYGLMLDDDFISDYEPVFAWEMEDPTEKQLSALEKCGIRTSAVTTKGLASKLLDLIHKRIDANMATPKQMKTLERYGFKNVGKWSKDDAGYMLTRLANNRWRLPADIIPEEYKPGDQNRTLGWEDTYAGW